MATRRKSRKIRTNGPARLGKPTGIIQPRVQKVGPERFGVVAIDCAKARSKWMLCDFYGKVLVPPREVEHARAQMQLAIAQFRDACQRHDIRDTIVAVEMTGTYHRPIQRAFREAGVETRLVHPFASKHYRLPAHGDNKTDDHDLEGIFRAAKSFAFKPERSRKSSPGRPMRPTPIRWLPTCRAFGTPCTTIGDRRPN